MFDEVVREACLDAVIFEQDFSGVREEATWIRGKSIPGRGSRDCKGHKVDPL